MTLRAELEECGYAIVRSPELVRVFAGDPWRAASELLGAAPVMVERQPIRAVPHGRSFASTSIETPLHGDAQSGFGVAPQLQLMACHRAAASGGETVLLDGWALMRVIETDDRSLHDALLEVPRRHRFVFGDVYGPTVALRGDALLFTHSPMPPEDPLGRRLAPVLDATPKTMFSIATDEILVVHNHRMLHGRRAFTDPQRHFTRLLVWTDDAFPTPPALHARAADVRARLDRALTSESATIRERFGLVATPPSDRIAIVTAMLHGEPPGVLATRHQIPEPLLYRWRDAALRAAITAVESHADDEPDLRVVLQRLQRG